MECSRGKRSMLKLAALCFAVAVSLCCVLSWACSGSACSSEEGAAAAVRSDFGRRTSASCANEPIASQNPQRDHRRQPHGFRHGWLVRAVAPTTTHRHARPRQLTVPSEVRQPFNAGGVHCLLTVVGCSGGVRHQWQLRRRRLRSSEGPGSYPPRCTSKCGECSPCYPVHVAVPPGVPVTTEYYPEAWRCKCGNRLYMP